MITKRFAEPRGINQGTQFYGFYARVSGQSRQLLRQAQRKAAAQLRGQPSNAVLLDELICCYLAEEVA